VGDTADIAYCLEGLAELAGERGEPYRAARLFGASEALLETVGTPLYAYASDRHSVEQAVSTLRSRLDEENFAAAWSEGRAMTQAEVIEYALATEQAHTSDEETPTSPLSTREAEILVLVAEGLTNPQIAEKLYLSPRTVGQHLRSIYRKLGVSSRAAATTYAVEHGTF
jgi:DNA-binding NarL/FixJ family response regulator